MHDPSPCESVQAGGAVSAYLHFLQRHILDQAADNGARLFLPHFYLLHVQAAGHHTVFTC